MKRVGDATKFLAIKVLEGYKRFVSPQLLPACRYIPTCSEYAIEAVDRYGVVCGGVMAIWRLLRCHPLASGGYDPLPNTKAAESCRTSSIKPGANGAGLSASRARY